MLQHRNFPRLSDASKLAEHLTARISFAAGPYSRRSARKWNDCCGAGFRMPARHDYSRALPGPASESLPGRNPRVAGWTVAVYGDLTGRRLGLEMRLRA